VDNKPNAAATTTSKYETADYAARDVLLVYPWMNMKDANAAASIAPANIIETKKVTETAAGTLSKITMRDGAASALTVGGVSYSVGSAALANYGPAAGTSVGTAETNYNLGTGMTAYMNNGWVLGVAADAVVFSDFVYIVKSDKGATTLSTYFKTGFVDQSGKAQEVTATNLIEGTPKPGSGQYDYTTVNATWGKMTENANGFTVTKAADIKSAKTISITGVTKVTSATPTIYDGVVADAKTVFIVYNGTSYKSYTGINNLPGFEKDSKAISGQALLPTYPGAHAAAIFLDVSGAKGTTLTTEMIYLVSSKAENHEIVEGKTYYNYTAIVNGEVVTLKSATADFGDGKFGVVVPTYDSNKYL
jgi:hypothetical protein